MSIFEGECRGTLMQHAATICVLAAGAVFVTSCSGSHSALPIANPKVRAPQDCQAVSSAQRHSMASKRLSTVGCYDDGGFGAPGDPSDPFIGSYEDPGPAAESPPMMPPPIPQTPPSPYSDTPYPGTLGPLWDMSDIQIAFLSGPGFDHTTVIAPDGISDVSIGISTAGTGSIPFPGLGHLYVQLWAFGIPVGAPLQAGYVSGKLRPAEFTQDVYGQPHVYIQGSPQYRSSLALQLARHQKRYSTNSSCWPDYTKDMNSNSWADGLLLSSGVSQSAINRYIDALQGESGLIPYSASNGSQIVACF